MVLIAMSTFSFVLACSVLSAGRTIESQDLILALLCAGLTSGAWGWTHRVSERVMAARVDERLEFGGAYLTAWEVANGELPRTPVAELLEARIAERSPRTRVLRAALPATMYWIAGPFLGGALLALALQEVRELRDNADPFVAARALAFGLTRAQSASGPTSGLEAQAVEQLEALQLEAEALAEAVRSSDTETRASAREKVELMTRRLAELASNAPSDSELRRQLEEAQVLADQAQMALEQEALGDVTRGDGESSEVNSSRGSGSRVSSGESVGTMSSPQDDRLAARSNSELGQQPPRPENGTLSAPGTFSRGRWWSARHDELVANWIEFQRNFD